MLYVETDDIYEVLEQHKEAFDFSNLKPSSRLYSKDNQKKLGKWKIETGKSLFFFYFTIVKFFWAQLFVRSRIEMQSKEV